jgi:glucose-6-phosphate isomerase
MEVRRLNEIKKVLFDKSWAKTAPNFKLYYMYRSVKKKDGLRYDITVIPARMLGKEFVKTKGHGHEKNYAEVYEVLKGKALYLIQKSKGNKILDVYAIKAKKGESVVVPPGYSHITINSASQDLKEANWVSEKCKNVYGPFEKMHGACYYYTKSGWTKNKNYAIVPILRYKKPLKKLPKNLDFLYGKNN